MQIEDPEDDVLHLGRNLDSTAHRLFFVCSRLHSSSRDNRLPVVRSGVLRIQQISTAQSSGQKVLPVSGTAEGAMSTVALDATSVSVLKFATPVRPSESATVIRTPP